LSTPPVPIIAQRGAKSGARLHREAAVLLLLILICRPRQPRWPQVGTVERVNRQDAGLAAPGHGWPVAAARGAVPECGHAEPKRGTEWWDKDLLVTFGAFAKSDPL
jgi:hypothetical protein